MLAVSSLTALRVFSNTNQYLIVFDEEVVSCAVVDADVECSPLGFSVLLGDLPPELSRLNLLVRFDDGTEHLIRKSINRTALSANPVSVVATCAQGDLTFPSVLIGGEQPVVSSDFVLSVTASGSATVTPDNYTCRCNIIGRQPIPLQYTSSASQRTFRFSQIPSAEYGTIDLLRSADVVWRFNVLFNH